MSNLLTIHRITKLWLLMSLTVLFLGCSSTPDPKEATTQDVSSTDEQIFVGDSIEMSYDPNVIMKRAESFFDKESYAEAIVEYKHFLDLHRNHILAPYAQYKIGVSHYKQFRTVDRDPEPLNNAITGFEKLLKEFPASRYEAEAKQTIQTCKEQLVQRHLMVGEFYYKRGSYLAAANRYEKIIKEFPELETTGEAMFHLAKTYQDLGIEEWSQDWLVALIHHYPNSPYHSSAQSLLASLQEDHPTLLAKIPHNPLPKEYTASRPSASSHEALPPNPNTTVFTNAGILPGAATSHPQTAHSNDQPTSISSCPIGAWCDSQSPQPNPPTPITTTTSSLPTDPKTCKTGEWC
ncbi:MAG: outer membrane protein assembly factor BamD [Nitrospirota bacterium]|nr:outer membrane protein assembly factor BamD [Nitrospirota bacterium]